LSWLIVPLRHEAGDSKNVCGHEPVRTTSVLVPSATRRMVSGRRSPLINANDSGATTTGSGPLTETSSGCAFTTTTRHYTPSVMVRRCPAASAITNRPLFPDATVADCESMATNASGLPSRPTILTPPFAATTMTPGPFDTSISAGDDITCVFGCFAICAGVWPAGIAGGCFGAREHPAIVLSGVIAARVISRRRAIEQWIMR
jgi:hypothetical protein